ncbi:MAG: transporter [Treponemataceae bacterium]|nr:transporter [Treponemataceae bacterium]
MTDDKQVVRPVLLMHAGCLLYSGYSLVGKAAAWFPFFSPPFIVSYGIVAAILCTYAVIWQQVLRHVPLFVATANKSVTVIWGILFGKLFFAETITWNMIADAAVILAGILLLAFRTKPEADGNV